MASAFMYLFLFWEREHHLCFVHNSGVTKFDISSFETARYNFVLSLCGIINFMFVLYLFSLSLSPVMVKHSYLLTIYE